MKKTYYESVFILDVEALSVEQNDTLFMCGSSNWEHYFSENQLNANVETLSNVQLLEFYNMHEFNNYINSHQIIDYSLEHKNPLVLSYV